MSPECLYWAVLALLVLPSTLFNKVALTVLTAWAFGQLAHMFSPFECAAYMFANIVAMGAALAVSRPWGGSRRATAQALVAFMFAPIAILYAVAAIYFEQPPQTMTQYYWQTGVYWTTWGFIMAQAVLVPLGNDWDRVKSFFDDNCMKNYKSKIALYE